MLSEEFWEERWQKSQTGWDIGYAAPAICDYIDSIADKKAAILIPGCGNAYEAAYLLDQGFSNITLIDIAATPVENARQKFADRKEIRIFQDDFFQHKGQYDYILEQTFFCALDPDLRFRYVEQMHRLLKDRGRLAGLLFNVEFEQNGPPFGGNRSEYILLFKQHFKILQMEITHRSIPPPGR